jgi:hypothetical protein
VWCMLRWIWCKHAIIISFFPSPFLPLVLFFLVNLALLFLRWQRFYLLLAKHSSKE